MRALIPQQAKSADKDLAKIQSFVLDSLAPITALVEKHQKMSVTDIKEAALTAVELIGNANGQILRFRREKLVMALNKDLAPLSKDDANFMDVSPDLFGPDFSKRAKEHLDQVRSLKAATNRQPWQHGDRHRRPFSQKGHPSERGAARGRGGGPNYKEYRGGRQSRQDQ
jgi:hypothetical protein